MNIKILAFGSTGVTQKAAAYLAKRTGGEVIPYKGFSADTGTYILGTNVHFGKFNKHFIKCTRSLIDAGAEVYAFISGAEIERKDYYIDAAKKLGFKSVRYVWGELDPSHLKGIKKFVVESFVDGRNKDGLPRPRLLDKELNALSDEVLKSIEE